VVRALVSKESIHTFLTTTNLDMSMETAFDAATPLALASPMWTEVLELLHSVWMEVAMFGMAALIYLVFAGNFTKVKITQKSPHSKKGCEEKEPPVAAQQAMSRALRANNLQEALDHARECHKISNHAAIRLLCALSKCLDFEDHVGRIASLNGKIDFFSFEAALTETLKHSEASHCHNLFKIATTLSLKVNDRALEAFAKGISADADLFQVFAENLCQSPHHLFGPKAVEALLSGCANIKNAELATKLFTWSQPDTRDLPPPARVCAGLVRTYVACKLFDKVCDFYADVMQPSKVPVDATLSEAIMNAATSAGRTELVQPLMEASMGDLTQYAKKISAYGKDGDLAGAVGVLQSLKDKSQAPTSFVYNCLLDACVQCGDLKLTLHYFSEMKDSNLVDVVSYNTVMKGHLAAGDTSAAEHLIKEMAERGLTANRISYHGLLNARVQASDRNGAWAIVEQMQAAGATPNAVTCSILLKSLVTNSGTGASDLAKVMQLMDNALAIWPEKYMDEVLFASMVEACIRVNRLDMLSERTKQYAKQGGLLKLTAPTYGSMIKAYGQAQDIGQVWELWQEMTNRQVKPSPITLGCMVEALVTNNCSDDAWQLVQDIWQDEDQRSSINTVIYSTILKGFSVSKQPEKVMQLYDEMRSRQIPCNTITYNTLLNAFARCGAMQRVPGVLEDMQTASPRVEPDIVTYSTIVKGYCMSGDVDKGFELLKAMQEDGKYTPDEVMFNSLLDGCAKQHRLDDALKLLDDMKGSDVSPSNYTLSILVKLLGRSRRLNQAFAMVDRISKEYGFRPNIQVYTCLIQACFNNRQHGKALTLHDEIVAHCRPDEKTYTALVKGCLQAGAVDKAVAMVRCAYHVQSQSIPQSSGAPPGIESRCLDEVIAKLGKDSQEAKDLLADVSKQKSNISAPPRRTIVTTNQRRVGGIGRSGR
jgi:pentatricopeptide repeat protein